jgi:hypothetical protein
MEESKYTKDIQTLYNTLLKISEKSSNYEEIKKKFEENKDKILSELKTNNESIIKRKKF